MIVGVLFSASMFSQSFRSLEKAWAMGPKAGFFSTLTLIRVTGPWIYITLEIRRKKDTSAVVNVCQTLKCGTKVSEFLTLEIYVHVAVKSQVPYLIRNLNLAIELLFPGFDFLHSLPDQVHIPGQDGDLSLNNHAGGE